MKQHAEIREDFRCEQQAHHHRRKNHRLFIPGQSEVFSEKSRVADRSEIADTEVPCRPGADQQKQKPQRTDEIRHDAHEQMRATRQRESAGEHQPHVLEISLAPAAVPLEVIDQRGWRFLVSPLQIPRQPDLPSSLDHQSGLDKIVAEDFPAERFLAGQRRKFAEFRKRLDADQRVVTPITALAELPEIQSANEHRTIQAHRKLLQARENRLTADQLRRCLQDPQPGTDVHDLRHRNNVASLHQAVGIQHQHAFISSAPGLDEIADVARLAVLVDAAAAVEDPTEGVELPAHVGPRDLLLHPEI